MAKAKSKKTGRIKAGEGNLIGNAGEHYVMAELLQAGVVAGLTPRNAPGFDIIAARKRKTACLRVKTKSHSQRGWQWNAKSKGGIFRDLSRSNDFLVLVNLPVERKRPEYYVLPTYKVNKWLKSGYRRWINTPGKKGQKRNEHTRRILVRSRYQNRLEEYRDAWKLLWQ